MITKAARLRPSVSVGLVARRRAFLRLVFGLALLTGAACSDSSRDRATASNGTSGSDTLVVFDAGSLAVPLRAALDSFAARSPTVVQQENAGSLETARQLTDLGKIPDVVALADYEVFPQLLMPAHTTWYAKFARNRMVLAYTPKSKFASTVTGANWYRLLRRPGVEVGRADPNLDPNGYRTLLTLQLAERYYHAPGLYAAMTGNGRNIRPKSVDLIGLLQAGELDYIWSYESVATAASLPFVRLPDEINLGNPADSAIYAVAVVRVRGKTPADTLTIHGQPIVYGLSIPRKAPHGDAARRFLSYLFSDAGKRVLRAAKLDALDGPIMVGTDAPNLTATAP